MKARVSARPRVQRQYRVSERRTVIIHALRYEPQGQRQRFEPHGEPRGDRWHKHIHLHLHLHLSFPMRQVRSHLSA